MGHGKRWQLPTASVVTMTDKLGAVVSCGECVFSPELLAIACVAVLGSSFFLQDAPHSKSTPLLQNRRQGPTMDATKCE